MVPGLTRAAQLVQSHNPRAALALRLGPLVSVWSILTCLILFLSDPVNLTVCWAEEGAGVRGDNCEGRGSFEKTVPWVSEHPHGC